MKKFVMIMMFMMSVISVKAQDPQVYPNLVEVKTYYKNAYTNVLYYAKGKLSERDNSLILMYLIMEDQSISFKKYLYWKSKFNDCGDDEMMIRMERVLATCVLVVDGLGIYDFCLFENKMKKYV